MYNAAWYSVPQTCSRYPTTPRLSIYTKHASIHSLPPLLVSCLYLTPAWNYWGQLLASTIFSIPSLPHRFSSQSKCNWYFVLVHELLLQFSARDLQARLDCQCKDLQARLDCQCKDLQARFSARDLQARLDCSVPGISKPGLIVQCQGSPSQAWDCSVPEISKPGLTVQCQGSPSQAWLFSARDLQARLDSSVPGISKPGLRLFSARDLQARLDCDWGASFNNW